MKLLHCLTCGDMILLRPEHRTCFCGASGGHYLEDGETVEQTAGTVSIALHNHDLRTAMQAFHHDPTVWSPLMVFRAYINPHCETDVRYVAPSPPAA
ncbi:MAG: hypothetical protein H0T79_12470 [Deltaproteobacteria bacterium]|nr:hypothetical protein [Deltaproteobacteria bacterium]